MLIRFCLLAIAEVSRPHWLVVDEADLHERGDASPANTRRRKQLQSTALAQLTELEALGPAVDRGEECVHALKGLAHPIRLAALIALGRGELSPSQFARSRGEPVSNVSYHFRLLAEVGLIELARTRPVRGSLEHVYRLVEPAGVEELKLTLAGELPHVLGSAEWVALVMRIVVPWDQD